MPPSPPPGYHTVTPSLTVHDGTAALEFYAKAFGATEKFRLPMPDGRIGHAEIQIGDSTIMISDEFPDWGALSPQTRGGPTSALMLYVEDVDAAFQRALEAGAQVVMPLADQFWGDRMGSVADPFGHKWSLATPVEEVPPEELQRRMEAFARGETGN
jgi:PhnB protein